MPKAKRRPPSKKNRFSITRKGGRPERYKKTEDRKEERERQAVSRGMGMQKVGLVPPRSEAKGLAHINHVPRTIPSSLLFRLFVDDPLFDKGHIGGRLCIEGSLQSDRTRAKVMSKHAWRGEVR